MPKNAVKAFGPFGFNAANLLATWQVMSTAYGAAKTPHPAFMIVISNASNTGVAVEFNDDPTAVQSIKPESDLILNFQTNGQPNGNVACLPIGTAFSVAGTAGVGFIYITIYYVEQS
jgi:hypothetical protein